MIASIFQGYLVQPRISMLEPIIKKPLAIKAETRAILQEHMESVVTMGTGKRIKNLKHLKMYAKTGTAQTAKVCRLLKNTCPEYIQVDSIP
jgi:cell division protein FtsI/penicillin-binding protein 2